MDNIRERIHAPFANVINQHCEELMRIWQRIGMDNQFVLQSRLPVIIGWITDLLEDMLRSEAALETSLIDSVRAKLAQVRQLESELRAELPASAVGQLVELAPIVELPESSGLIQRDNQLSQRIADLQSVRLRIAAQAVLNQMQTLWRRLQIDRPHSERQFWERLAASRHPTPDCLQRLESELARLRQQVLPRLRDCVADCRREILELAERCLAAPAELAALRPLLESDDWSEDLLDRHEAAAASLRDRLTRHGEFYAALANWQIAWTSLQSLQQRLKDPAVLNNRGGVLLRLERERKRAQSVVAATEAALLRLEAEAAASAAARPTVRGLPLAEFLSGVRQRAEAEKENEARLRLEKHETTLRRELQFGSRPASPMQRRVIHNSSRLVACKVQPTVAKNQSKVGCGGRIEKRKSGKTSALVTAQKLLRRSVKRLQQDNSSILMDLPETKQQQQQQQHDVSITSTYSAFQSGIGFRSSTVLPTSAAAAAAAVAAAAAAASAPAAAVGGGGIGGGVGTGTGSSSSSSRHRGVGSQCDSGLSSLANH